MAYLDSDKIKVYPSAYRGTSSSGQVYDPESRLFTEKNSGYPYRALSSVDNGNFVVSQENKKITFVLHGYYFEADFSNATNIDWTKPIYANIKIEPKGTQASGSTAYSAESLISWNENQNTLDDSEKFTGVNFTNNAKDSNAHYSLKIWDGNSVPATSYQKFKSSEVQIGKGIIGEGYALSDLISDHSVGGVNSNYILNKVVVGNQSGWLQSHAKLEPSKLSFIRNDTSAASSEEQIVLDGSTNSAPGLTLNKKGITVNGANVKLITSGGVAANLDVSGTITSKSNISASGSISATSSGNISSVSGDIYTLSGDVYSNTGKIYTGNGDIKITSSGSIYTKSGDIKITESGNIYTTSGNIYTSSGNIYTSNGDITTQTGNVQINSSGGDLVILNSSGSGTKKLRTNFPQKIEVTDYSSASGGYKIEVTSENGSNIISKGGSTVASFDIKHVPIIDTKSLVQESNSGSTPLPILYTANSSDQSQKYICTDSKFGITYNTGSTTYGNNYITSPAFKEGDKLLEDKYIQKSSFLKKGQLLVGTESGKFKAAPAYPASTLAYKHLAYDSVGNDLIWTAHQYVDGEADAGSTQYFTSSSTNLSGVADAKSINMNQSPDALYYYVSSSGVTLYSTNFRGTNYYGTSDARLKENVVDTSFDSVKLLSEMKIRDFNWKTDKPENKNIGVIAQELEKILPEEYKKEFIYEGDYQSATDNQYLAVNDSKLVYVLIDAFKKLKAEVDELKNKLGGK